LKGWSLGFAGYKNCLYCVALESGGFFVEFQYFLANISD
jgi:hypothetical protein